MELKCKVMDDDIGSDEKLGECKIELEKLGEFLLFPFRGGPIFYILLVWYQTSVPIIYEYLALILSFLNQFSFPPSTFAYSSMTSRSSRPFLHPHGHQAQGWQQLLQPRRLHLPQAFLLWVNGDLIHLVCWDSIKFAYVTWQLVLVTESYREISEWRDSVKLLRDLSWLKRRERFGQFKRN